MLREEVIKQYKKWGIDPHKAMETLRKVPIGIQCWQLDDVQGFENVGPLSGGIAATGNYPGKARNFAELTADFEMAFKHIPGTKKVNLHASYRTTTKKIDRKDIGPEEFRDWVEWAKANHVGLDFNPTLFSSPWVKNNLTLSSPEKSVRDYWITHCINSRKIAEYFGRELKQKALCNIWIPDGFKDTPADRKGPRERLRDALDEIMAVPIDNRYADTSMESKLFGIGIESYTTGSHEFYLSYALKNDCFLLMDTGHYHPTENVAEKLSAILCFTDKLGLHVSRPVRWDSDHVLRWNDDLLDIANELVKCDVLDKAYICLDYFDASINRVAALVIGTRNIQKALLNALLTPWDKLKKLQDASAFTELLATQEMLKTMPFSEVWAEYCKTEKTSDDFTWFDDVTRYEREVMLKREQ